MSENTKKTITMEDAKSNAMAHMQSNLKGLTAERASLLTELIHMRSKKAIWKNISAALFALLISLGVFTYNYTKALRENNIALYNAHKVDQLGIDIYRQTVLNVENDNKYKEQALLDCVTKSAMMK